MNIMTLKALVVVMVLGGTGLVLSSCNTTKATVDTFAKFTSSTSPGEWVNADGIIQKDKKARLFAAVAYENLEQDIARGNGEYLTSLGVLLNISTGQQEEFWTRSQYNYPLLFDTEQQTAESLLARLNVRRSSMEATVDKH